MLSDVDAERLRSYLTRTSGLAFEDSRRPALSVAVDEAAQACGLPDSDALVRMLFEPGSDCAARSSARRRLLDAVTIGETHFFRNPPQIDALRRVVLPRLLRRDSDGGRTGARRPLTVWSAGCSTGEEPYTLAMLLLDLLGHDAPRRARVLGTDISASAVRTARMGRFGARSVMMAAPADRERWLEREADGWSVREPVRALVGLAVHNLAVDAPPLAPASVDLLLCRNVTIYFDRATTVALMARLHEVIAPGGFLVLGHAESLWQLSDDFELVPVGDAFVYRRLDRARGASPSQRDVPGQRAGRTTGAAAVSRPGDAAAASRPGEAGPSGVGRRDGAAPRQRRPEVGVDVEQVASFGSPRRGPDADAQPRTPQDQLEGARAALAGGRYAEAALLASRAAAAEPTLAAAYVVEGHALITLNRDSEALVPLRKAAYLNPDAGDAHFLLAGAQDRLGYASAAAREYRLAAQTLRQVTPEALGDILDGRGVDELVALCEHLARRSARGDGPS